MSISRAARSTTLGMTLIEVLFFIVTVGVALAGVLSVLDITSKFSADPVIRKQMLSIAEALLEEVQSQPFTYCDPSDANAAIATAASLSGTTTPCATLVQSFGQPSGQTRPPNGTFSINHVANYCALTGTASTTCLPLNLASPIADTASSFLAPTDYSASIQLTAENLGPAGAQITSSDPAATDNATTMNVLRIAVTVNYKNDSLVLEGYRTRYAPNYFP